MEITGSSKCPCGSRKRFDECCESKVAVFGKPVLMTNFDIWKFQYMEKRYLEHVSQEELIVRENDIVANVTFLKDDLSRGVYPAWVELWAHVQVEWALRENRQPKPLVDRIKDEKLPSSDRPGLLEAVKTFKSMSIKEGTYWVKYGKYEHLKDTLSEGKLRISPASFYDDPSLNSAQRDSELELSYFSLGSEVTIQTINSNIGQSDGSFKPLRNVQYTISSQTDYYVCCLCMTFDQRIFSDFLYDCALIIKDPQKFLEKIIRAFKDRLPTYRRAAQPVRYFDPFNSNPRSFPVHFAKHFRFSYQKEYRIIWVPPSHDEAFDYVNVEMGNLEDICEVICLASDGTPS